MRTEPGASLYLSRQGLVDGAIASVEITATDAAGNASPTTSDSFLVDTTAPTSPTITSPTVHQ